MNDRKADAALDAALSRRMELITQIPKLAAELKTVEQFIGTWYQMAGFPAPVWTQSVMRGSSVRVKNLPKEEVVRVAVEILRDEGKPLRRADLFCALIERGITLYGKDPQMVLSTMLWRSQDQVMRTPAGYVPVQAKVDA